MFEDIIDYSVGAVTDRPFADIIEEEPISPLLVQPKILTEEPPEYIGRDERNRLIRPTSMEDRFAQNDEQLRRKYPKLFEKIPLEREPLPTMRIEPGAMVEPILPPPEPPVVTPPISTQEEIPFAPSDWIGDVQRSAASLGLGFAQAGTSALQGVADLNKSIPTPTFIKNIKEKIGSAGLERKLESKLGDLTSEIGLYRKQISDEIRKEGGVVAEVAQAITDQAAETALTLGVLGITGFVGKGATIRQAVVDAGKFGALTYAQTPGTPTEKMQAAAHSSAFMLTPLPALKMPTGFLAKAVNILENLAITGLGGGYTIAYEQAKVNAKINGTDWKQEILSTATPLAVNDILFGLLAKSKKVMNRQQIVDSIEEIAANVPSDIISPELRAKIEQTKVETLKPVEPTPEEAELPPKVPLEGVKPPVEPPIAPEAAPVRPPAEIEPTKAIPPIVLETEKPILPEKTVKKPSEMPLEPMIPPAAKINVYHGSNKKGITQFDTQRNVGTFFISDKKIASKYAGKEGEVYQRTLQLKNPLKWNTQTTESFGKWLTNQILSEEETPHYAIDAYDSYVKSHPDYEMKSGEKGLKDAIDEFYKFKAGQIEYRELDPLGGYIRKFAESLGHDSIIRDYDAGGGFKRGDEYIVFHPEQISTPTLAAEQAKVPVPPTAPPSQIMEIEARKAILPTVPAAKQPIMYKEQIAQTEKWLDKIWDEKGSVSEIRAISTDKPNEWTIIARVQMREPTADRNIQENIVSSEIKGNREQIEAYMNDLAVAGRATKPPEKFESFIRVIPERWKWSDLEPTVPPTAPPSQIPVEGEPPITPTRAGAGAPILEVKAPAEGAGLEGGLGAGEGPGTPPAKELGLLTTFGVEPGKSRLKGLLETVKKSSMVSEIAKKELGEIESEYEQQRTKEMKNKVLNWFTEKKVPAEIESRITEAETMVRNPEEDLDTKGAVGVALLEHYRNTGNDLASVSLVEHLDPLMRGAGRLNQAASMVNQLTGKGWIDVVNKYLTEKKIELPDDIRKQIELEFKLSAGIKDEKMRAEALHKTLSKIASYVPFKTGEWIDAYRYTNMLSNFQSHARNIYGNTVQTLITRPLSLMANRDFSGAKTYLAKAFQNVMSGEALKITKESFDKDFSKWAETLDDPKASILDVIRREQGPQGKVQKIAWKSLTAIPKFLQAQDVFFGSMINAGETARLAAKGKSPEAIQDISKKLEDEYLYRQKLGGKRDKSQPYLVQSLEGLANLLEKGRTSEYPMIKWPMKWTVPFLRTPIRIAQFSVKGSPLAYLGPRITAENIAKMKYGKNFDKLSDSEQFIITEDLQNRKGLAAIGTIVSLLGLGAASTGNTTWGVPQDQKTKQMFYASGRRPYSFRIPGTKTWVPMSYLGPWFLAFALPAAVRDAVADNPALVDEPYIKQLGIAAFGIPKIILSLTPLAGVGGLLEALQGKLDTTVSSALGFQASQFVPASGLVRWVNKIIDPTYRKPVTIAETIEAGIPGLSQEVKAYQEKNNLDAKRPWTDIYLPYTIGVGDEQEEKKYLKRVEILKQRMKYKKEIEKQKKSQMKNINKQ